MFRLEPNPRHVDGVKEKAWWVKKVNFFSLVNSQYVGHLCWRLDFLNFRCLWKKVQSPSRLLVLVVVDQGRYIRWNSIHLYFFYQFFLYVVNTSNIYWPWIAYRQLANPVVDIEWYRDQSQSNWILFLVTAALC